MPGPSQKRPYEKRPPQMHQTRIPHAVTPTVEDEESPETPQTYLNLDGNYFFDVTTATACFCKTCSNDCASGQSHVENLYSVD